MKTTLCGLVLLFSVTAGQVLAADSAERGQRLAERWCSACHTIKGEGKTATDAVRSFKTIAQRRDKDSIVAKLNSPHGSMTTDMLTSQDMRDLATFIVSQK